ncbi:uncharacterized protein LOC119995564 [Tripterygium wilfordii]|uniref:uncharacterized protein LOC119995564 n=1 Tax=Tripterygium wilfordii TaxID=458696 RepID=UPI0018F808C2|nr:uncharacterized protein LOC119995564 [Tripterygium wilfordii]
MVVVVQAETMGDLNIPTIPESPSCITLSTAARNYELQTIHFNMMPSFHGLSSEDPLSHIREIFNIVSSMSLTIGVTKEHLMMKIFPHIMKDKAKMWQSAVWITPYMDRDSKQNQCPHHALPILVLMGIFYKALTIPSKAAVNNYAGGSIRNMTPSECQTLFERLAIETQHSKVRGKRAGVYEISNFGSFAPKLQVDAISTKLDMLLAMNGHTIQGMDFFEVVQEQANMMNSYNRNPMFDPYSNSYNPGFPAHPNFSWKNTQNQANLSTITLEDMVRQLTINRQKLEAQVGQIAEALSKMEARKFPSQTEVNPNNREHAMAITLCDEQQSRVAIKLEEQKVQAQEQPFQQSRRGIKYGLLDPDKPAPPVKPYLPPVSFPGGS